MDLETFIIAVFCLVDDFVRDLCRGRRLRQRGPAPILADSEVLTVEITGEFLGLDTDRGLHAYFQHHFGHLFPGLRTILEYRLDFAGRDFFPGKTEGTYKKNQSSFTIGQVYNF